MRKKHSFLVSAASLMLTVLISGCQNLPDGPETGLPDVDKNEILQSIATDPLFTSDANTLNDDGDVMTLGKTATPIYPRAWGRRINRDSVSRDVTFEHPNDTTVIATVKTTISGIVIIRAKYSMQDTTLTTITKPFRETTIRIIKFYKNRFVLGRRWIPREVSAVKGGTEGSLVTIERVRVIIGTDTLTIDDPLNYFLKLGRFGGREVPELPTNFLQTITVQASVTSADPDTDIVSLHRPYFMMSSGIFKPLGVRMQMISQTQNGSSYSRVYERSWVGLIPGRHHMFVGALTRGSIFDDAAAFSSQLWGVPYIVN